MSRALVIYRGPSRFDPSATIRAILVPDSKNAKTGPMVQLFIVPDLIAPHTAQITGDDLSVCGTCPLRPKLSGGCYVVTCQGALSTWKATADKGIAGAAEVAAMLRGKTLRLGAYGDSAALPAWLVPYLAYYTRDGAGRPRVTGYTHGHTLLGIDGVSHLRAFCMLSAETEAQAVEAVKHGWRYFRTRREGAPLLPREIDCPSPRVECATCLLCRGTTLGAASVSIPVHGSRKNRALAVVQ
jgi:hypothetical protein